MNPSILKKTLFSDEADIDRSIIKIYSLAALGIISFLLSGYFFIRRKSVKRHAICMLSAFTASSLFLVSYLYYHAHHGATPFPGKGGVRVVYFTILVSHTVLAIVQVPLIAATLYQAARSRFQKHVRVARLALPVWLYVSVTGVVVYWMLYQIRYIS